MTAGCVGRRGAMVRIVVGKFVKSMFSKFLVLLMCRV